MKKFIKQLPKTNGGQWLIAFIVMVYVRLIQITCKFHIEGKEQLNELRANNQPFILAIWHGRLLLMPLLFPRGIHAHALISDHSDGRIVKKAAKLFGYDTVVGSSSKGGAKALKEMVAHIKKGDSLFITPDGPKGPRGHFEAGTAEVSRMTGAPVIPVSVSCDKAKFAKSWDKFMLPKLFSNIYIHYGEALSVDKKAKGEEREQFYTLCKERIDHVENMTDKKAGVK